MLKTIAFLKGRKWTTMMVKRVYFGNWLRDYSQAMDVGTLKNVQADAIRILVWVLGFLSFGYATEEFEVTAERLGVYRPEEHIDNPKDYADNKDAREYDPRLRPPIQPIELEIDMRTGMKNYIANESLGIATSSGYIKHSLQRSIHFGRLYTSGAGNTKGKDADLYEALRCLGQSLHCMEDFGAHSNYVELSLRELGHRNVFPHTGVSTEIDLHGHRVYPIVTGSFGMVDFIHSVLGEATDHFTQSEVDDLNKALASAEGSGGGSRSANQIDTLTSLLGQVPGAGPLAQQARELQADSQHQERINASRAVGDTDRPVFQGPPGTQGAPPAPGIPGMSADFDPVKTAAKIYPILELRDKIAKAIALTIEKIPGLESLVEKITETVTLFILSLLAPFVRPVIEAVAKSLKTGSSGVIDASGRQQYEPWANPNCTDPTHSLLSKDHFSNVLNEPAGKVAATILQYVAPRILYAWEHPDVPVEQILDDVSRAFHHPALRDRNCELHTKMFRVVEEWARAPHAFNVDQILSSDSVRAGKNQVGAHGQAGAHSHAMPAIPTVASLQSTFQASATHNFGGSSREGGLDEAQQLAARYPGTETDYDRRGSQQAFYASGAAPPQAPYGGEAAAPQQPAYGQPAYGHGGQGAQQLQPPYSPTYAQQRPPQSPQFGYSQQPVQQPGPQAGNEQQQQAFGSGAYHGYGGQPPPGPGYGY